MSLVDDWNEHCPTCRMPLVERTVTWGPPPDGLVEQGADGVRVTAIIGRVPKRIEVTCSSGHRFTAQTHEWSIDRGHRYRGLAPVGSHEGSQTAD
jgi:hypothetical protein